MRYAGLIFISRCSTVWFCCQCSSHTQDSMLTEKVRYFIDPGEPPVCDENSGFEVYFCAHSLKLATCRPNCRLIPNAVVYSLTRDRVVQARMFKLAGNSRWSQRLHCSARQAPPHLSLTSRLRASASLRSDFASEAYRIILCFNCFLFV